MPIDDRTTNRSYKLPNAGNFLTDDVQRLREALQAIDADVFARYTKAEADQKIADLINGAPGALDTLNELAAAMGDDPNFAATITNALAGKPGFADVWTRSQADARYVQGINQTENNFTGTGSQTTFTLTQAPPSRESILVSVDGVIQPVAEYTLSGTGLILSEAPANGARIRVLMLGVAGPVQNASTLNFTQAGVGAINRTVESKLRDVVSVKDFGAVGDGVTDDTAAIKAAFAAAEALPNNNRVVYFPCGVYQFDGTTAIPISKATSILGEEFDSVRIRFTGSTCNFLSFTNERGWSVRNISFRTTTNCTSGTVIQCNASTGQSQDSIIDRVGFRGGDGRLWDIIHLGPNTSRIYMSNLVFSGGFNRGIRVNCSHNNYLRSFLFDGDTAGNGIDIQGTTSGNGVEVFHMSDGIIANCGRALYCVGESLARFSGIAGIKAERVWFDDSKLAEGAYLRNCLISSFVECHFVSNDGQAGCWVTDCDTIDFIGCHFSKNVRHGLRIENDAVRVSAIGGSASDNNDLSSATNYAGIWVEGGTQNFVISGVQACGATSVYNKPQQYGIEIGNGCNNFSVTNCLLVGNTVAGLFNNSGYGAGKIVRDNIGFASENRGNVVGTTNGAGEIVVIHGLPTTPGVILIAGRSNDQFDYRVSSRNQTNFTVIVGTSSTGAIVPLTSVNFDWNAWL